MYEPIAALCESQTWCHGEFSVSVRRSGDGLDASIATVGRDGDLPANEAEMHWVDAAADGIPGITRDWGPRWMVPLASWDAFRSRLDVWLSLRSLRYERYDPAVVAQFSAQLRRDWSATLYWTFSPTSAVMIELGSHRIAAITGGDPYLPALREALGVAIEAPTPTHRRLLEIRRDRANALFERAARWSPETLSWVSGAVFGKRPDAGSHRPRS